MTKFREKEYIKILKSLGGTEANPTKTAEILKKIKDETEEKRKEEEQLMPHPKGDETQPNPITHQTAWALLHDARIYVKSIYEIKSQASS